MPHMSAVVIFDDGPICRLLRFALRVYAYARQVAIFSRLFAMGRRRRSVRS